MYGQKVSDLVLYPVNEEIEIGYMKIIGQGFKDSEYGRLPLNIKDSIRSAVWDLSRNSAGDRKSVV